MKKLLIGTFCLFVVALTACSKDDNNDNGNTDQPDLALITPEINVQVADPLNQNPFTGVVEIYPCDAGSSVYYGNYINGKLTVFNGYYMIENGNVFGEYNRELHLPIGIYNMVYWGTPKYDEPIYNSPAINHPGITSNVNLSQLYFTLRANSDGTYIPVYDLVHAVKAAEVGTENLQTSLTRVTAGLKVIVRQEDNSVFSSNITSVMAYINNIAEKMNFYTAEAENMTKTVKFELSRSTDATIMSNATVMLFPSAPNPTLELVITLADGTEHKLSKQISSTLSANTRLTLNIVIGKILPEGNPGDFTIENWNEESETIEFPIVD